MDVSRDLMLLSTNIPLTLYDRALVKGLVELFRDSSNPPLLTDTLDIATPSKVELGVDVVAPSACRVFCTAALTASTPPATSTMTYQDTGQALGPRLSNRTSNVWTKWLSPLASYSDKCTDPISTDCVTSAESVGCLITKCHVKVAALVAGACVGFDNHNMLLTQYGSSGHDHLVQTFEMLRCSRVWTKGFSPILPNRNRKIYSFQHQYLVTLKYIACRSQKTCFSVKLRSCMVRH